MDSINSIMARGTSLLVTRDDSTLSPLTLNLIIVLMVLMFVSLVLIGTLYMVRRMRRSRAIKRQQLPQYNDSSSPKSKSRRLTITATPYGQNSNIYLYDEKSSIMSNASSTPTSPVPEIRITFPDEQDESGRRKSGRVLVVRVGETSVGLEPMKEEQLPAYARSSNDHFDSIDMERIGGLKEKSFWS